MFLGSYKTFFSGKNRLILPKKIRKELGNQERFYLILGEDGEIWGFDQSNWGLLAGKVLARPLSSLEGRHQRRKLFALADECVLDAQGRFILPSEFVEGARLQAEVMIVGAGDHFEIWDSRSWEKVKQELKKS